MNFVIPMAGRGQRFADAGYTEPKPLIELRGKTLIQWSVDSLPLKLCTNLLFIMLREHDNEYRIADRIRQWYRETCPLNFVFLPDVTGGQAETVWKARHVIKLSEPLLIYNIDTYFRSETLDKALQRDDIDGLLGAFKHNSPRFSFAETDSQGLVTRVAEKEPISSNALTGLYHFSRAGDFIRAAEESIEAGITTKGEFYVAPMYNRLIEEGKKFILDFCSQHHILGTPAELRLFRGPNHSG
jgi:dTDP-glucose pyrophosphorylase